MTDQQPNQAPLLYCHCAYAKVVPGEVKREVLSQLANSGRSFETVADLCEMSAKRDPALGELMKQSGLRIAACYPRAVKWLCSAAGASLPDDAQVINMRTLSADEVVQSLMATSGTLENMGKLETNGMSNSQASGNSQAMGNSKDTSHSEETKI